MDRIQKTEEALSIIWEEREKKSCDKEMIRKKILEKVGEDILECLAIDGHVTVGGDCVKLTPKGEVMARDITRRQRLAERLLTDVLELDRKAMDSSACERPSAAFCSSASTTIVRNL